MNLHDAVTAAREKFNYKKGRGHKGSPSPRKKPRKIVECACGCGEKLETPDKYCKERRYIQGHNNRGKKWRNKDHAKDEN
jgi:hypothetical protein